MAVFKPEKASFFFPIILFVPPKCDPTLYVCTVYAWASSEALLVFTGVVFYSTLSLCDSGHEALLWCNRTF